ncbi:MAG: hypothetical protein V4598_00125 [Bdellovibrionota bacterium]
MKWILLLSFILNGVLGYQLLNRKEIVREEIVEKVVVKSATPQVIEKKVIVKVPGESAEAAPSPREFDEKDMEDVVVNVTKDREDFLVGKLNFSEKQFKDIEQVKNRFYEKYQKIIPQNGPGYLTLEQRKAIIALEEERDAEYERALGGKKWKEWESFRDNYNQKMFKRMIKDNGVIVPMEI